MKYSTQLIQDDDVDAVVAVLRSESLTTGPVIDEFEKKFAERHGSKFGIGFNSATSALHIGLLALGLTPNDIAWTVSLSFVATANAIKMIGSDIDFVDISKSDGNISVDHLEEKLKSAAVLGKLPSVVVPVAFGGRIPEMEKIWSLSNLYGFKVLLDASHAIGSEYNGEACGSSYAHATVFSMHPVKIITSGEGGMLTTSDEAVNHKARILRSHGIERDREKFVDENLRDCPPWAYQQHLLGWNYRLSDIHAALGYSQLKKLDIFHEKRVSLARYYFQKLDNLKLFISPPQENIEGCSWHLYPVLINHENGKEHRLKLYEHLQRNGVGVGVHYIPIHTQPFYRSLNPNWNLPNTMSYYDRELSLPLHCRLTNEDIDRVVDLMIDFGDKL